MTRPFRFGYQARALADHEELVADARRAEALGYDEMWTYDHVGEVDPFVPLIVAAEATSTLRIGPLVLNNELHHPVLLARTAATVDRLSGGRLTLGFGTGYAQAEHDAAGIELRPPGERVSRLGESLQVVRDLLDTGRCSFDGAHHHLALDDLGIRPAQGHVPFLVGGHGRRVIGLAARHADVFQFTGLTHGEGGRPSPGGFAIADVEQRARWLSDAAGERDARIERSVLVQVTDVADDASGRIDEMAARFRTEPGQLAATPFVLIGSVAQVVDELERLRERIGVSHVVVREAEGFAPVVDALRGR
jgi:probable F420-dependent oxidoreductase